MGVLDDGRDAVRNAGLLLLVDLTSGANEELRKIVAFEDVFAKVFALIQMEGGLAEAGITAQDCLSLLANLIKGSSSNQTMFRESGCVTQLAQLLQQAFPSSEPEAPFISQSREKSAFGLLQLMRLFLVSGESNTPQNQAAFFRAEIAQILIDLGFDRRIPIPVRVAALKTAAELIANNASLQEAFAALQVAYSDASAAPSMSSSQQLNGSRSNGPSNKGSARVSAEKPRVYIIEGLLDVTLDQPRENSTLRSATCDLIQAYLAKHDRIRAHFLQRAIFGHAQQEEAANVLSTLSQPDGDATGVLFASWIVQDLIAENVEAKTALGAVKEGDESEGEDVLSFIQALGSGLEGSLQQDADVRVVSAYASLLVVFLWEFAAGIDDLLEEASSLLQLLTTRTRTGTTDPLVGGLCAVLLGTIYEFSTKDSPIPRRTLAPLLTQKLGRLKYLEALAELRRQPAVRDFDLMDPGSEDTILRQSFVELFSVEYSRLRKAIDKDPGVEVLPPSVAEAGVDRDVLDDLRQQIQAAKDAAAQAQDHMVETNQKHEHEQMSSAKELQTAIAEIDRLRRINQAMQQGHEIELEKLKTQHEQSQRDAGVESQRRLATAQQETQREVQNAVREKEDSFTSKIQEFERRIAEMGNAHRIEQSSHANTRQQLEGLTTKHTELISREQTVSAQFADLTQKHSRLEIDHANLKSSSTQTTSELESVSQESEKRFFELERLNQQLKDLQDELKGKEEELAAERAGFADLEKELEIAKSALATSQKNVVENSGQDAMKKELEQAQEGEKAAKEELESMLLVMGDIEAKRDEYRARVKELGGEVSDDDEDGEDGEDQGEDDDEDDEEEDEGVD